MTNPPPLEICLEELSPESEEPYIRCVALPGGEPGLALDRAGSVRWMPAEPTDFGLWVSADEKLVLLRGAGAGPITVRRAGRALQAPEGAPVVLRDQDLLELAGRSLRVHVHGVAAEIHPPERFSLRSLQEVARATAAALALTAAIGGTASAETGVAGPPPIEVRARPPKPVSPRRLVLCDVTSIRTPRSGATVVQARCPAGPVPPVGSRGQLLDRGGAPVTDGWVEVTKVVKNELVGETALRNPKAARVRFYTNY
jgi:hypothetical protein